MLVAREQIVQECGEVQILGKPPNKLKKHSRRNKEQIENMECLLAFGSESSVLQFRVPKYQD